MRDAAAYESDFAAQRVHRPFTVVLLYNYGSPVGSKMCPGWPDEVIGCSAFTEDGASTSDRH